MAGELEQFEILLGVTGGIAAYKSALLCSKLVQAGAGVTVAMTEHAQKFVGALTFSTLTGRQVYTDMFAAEQVYDTRHISLTERSDLFVVAPATANIIGKLAGGICDDLLSTLLAAADSDVLLAPAMNSRMWGHPAVKRNMQTLAEWGIVAIGPDEGRLACGTTGAGRMCSPEEIYDKITALLKGLTPKRNGN